MSLFPTNSLAYSATFNEYKMENLYVIDPRPISVEPTSNRYYTTIERGNMTYKWTKRVTEKDIRDKNINTLIIGLIPYVGPVYAVGNFFYGLNTPGTITCYTATDRHYRVDRLTGEKKLTATYIRAKFVCKTNEGHTKTFSSTARIK